MKSPEAEATTAVDIEKVKSMLNLPETSTDVELITVLVNLIANLQEKYESVLNDAVKVEEEVVNRAMEDFGDVIDASNVEFWKEQFLMNRDQTLATLQSIQAKIAKPAPVIEAPVAPAARLIPLRNRVSNQPPVTSKVIEAPVSQTEAAANVIKNRAADIVAKEGIPFTLAFNRAADEFAASAQA